MNVKIAAQTLSSSVADAIDFLRMDLQHPKFQGSKETTEFIRKIDRLFHILNSRNPFAKGYKKPLTAANREYWTRVLEVYVVSSLFDRCQR
jgi:hypothetical protein